MAFLSSSFAVSAYKKLKTCSVCFNLSQFPHTLSKNKPSDFTFIPGKLKTCSVGFGLQHSGHGTVWRNRSVLHASAYGLNAVGSVSSISHEDPDHVPMPLVVVFQDFDCDVTVVKFSFGDEPRALNDTMKALKGLGLAVSNGIIFNKGSVQQTTIFIRQVDTGHKVEDSDMLDRILLTIVTNLLKFHSEYSEQRALGEASGVKTPEEKLVVGIALVTDVQEDGPKRRFAAYNYLDATPFCALAAL